MQDRVCCVGCFKNLRSPLGLPMACPERAFSNSPCFKTASPWSFRTFTSPSQTQIWLSFPSSAEELKAVGKRIKRAIAPETNDNQDKAPVSPETKPSREIPEAGWAEAAGDTVKVNAAPAPVEPKITPEEEERLFWEPIGGKPE